MDSIITWIGGKKSLRKQLLAEFPNEEEFDTYIEVFGGAGWLLFSKEKQAKKEVYNDINGELVNMFLCIKEKPEEVLKEFDLLLNSREMFKKKVLEFKQGLGNDVERAASFLYLTKFSYGADRKSYGLKCRSLNNIREHISLISERLDRVIVENLDFERLLKNYAKERSLVYLDPPYYGTESYYEPKFEKKDHLRLFECLKKAKYKWILSYNDCECIRDLYKGYSIKKVERQHNLKAKYGVGDRYSELIIKNF